MTAHSLVGAEVPQLFVTELVPDRKKKNRRSVCKTARKDYFLLMPLIGAEDERGLWYKGTKRVWGLAAKETLQG